MIAIGCLVPLLFFILAFLGTSSTMSQISATAVAPATPQSSAPILAIYALPARPRACPLILQEVGYPTSTRLGSSEEKQAEFVSNVYTAWKAKSSQILFLNFFLMHDFAPTTCDDFTAYYGLPDNKSFHEFLCTLGLRKADGTPKLAWKAFVDGARGIEP